MSANSPLFDRAAVRHHRDRAARYGDAASFLHDEVADRLAERLDEVHRALPVGLNLACGNGRLARAMAKRSGAERVVQADLSLAMARTAKSSNGFFPTLVVDEERLPIAPGQFDLVASGLGLHWVNDLPGALIQIRRALKPDGLFVAAIFGGATLAELRDALTSAELELEGGAGPRISPFTNVRDAGALLQRAGFALPMVDRDRVTVTYEHAFGLMVDLRRMGEANALTSRRREFSRRETLVRAAEIYLSRFADKAGRLRASFEILYLTGWAPDPSQPRPLKPGSAAARLADALGTEESRGEDSAPPEDV